MKITAYKVVAKTNGKMVSFDARNWVINGQSMCVEYVVGKTSVSAVKGTRLMVFKNKEEAFNEAKCAYSVIPVVLQCEVSPPLLIWRPIGLISNLKRLMDLMNGKENHPCGSNQQVWVCKKVKPIKILS